jgi:hypothetical protein
LVGGDNGEGEVIIGWDCGEWSARGGRLLGGGFAVPAVNPAGAGPRVLAMTVGFARKSGMPSRVALEADSAAVGLSGPEREAWRGWLAGALGLHGQPARVSVAARGCPGADGGACLTAAYGRDGSVITVR